MNYNNLIDHTLLKPEATQADIDKLIAEAIKYQFKTICVNTFWVKYASQKLVNSDIGITAVIGFPLGAMATEAKIFEAKLAIEEGASEIDMVINIGKFKSKDYLYVEQEIAAIKQTIGNKILKVIIETALLDEAEIAIATQLVVKANADFVKTSTGFSNRGASLKDIEIMKENTAGKIEIKAAGGIKNLRDMENMYRLGATRFGTSSAVQILNQEKPTEKY
ncbi:deoxyribose-phosphate aldolase [Candidatus Mycoplasma pogonae]